MVAADWWATGWQQLPARRIDLAGETEEPLTLQWAGSLQDLQDILQSDGWRAPASWTPVGTLAWLTRQTDPTNLPVVPYPAGGRLPSLTLVRPSGNAAAGSRLTVRIWAVDFELKNGSHTPLWIGSVVEERLYHPFSLFTLASTQPDMNAPPAILAAALDGGRLFARTDGSADANWDGRILLVREGATRRIEYR
jgi:hypothetical protein